MALFMVEGSAETMTSRQKKWFFGGTAVAGAAGIGLALATKGKLGPGAQRKVATAALLGASAIGGRRTENALATASKWKVSAKRQKQLKTKAAVRLFNDSAAGRKVKAVKRNLETSYWPLRTYKGPGGEKIKDPHGVQNRFRHQREDAADKVTSTVEKMAAKNMRKPTLPGGITRSGRGGRLGSTPRLVPQEPKETADSLDRAKTAIEKIAGRTQPSRPKGKNLKGNVPWKARASGVHWTSRPPKSFPAIRPPLKPPLRKWADLKGKKPN